MGDEAGTMTVIGRACGPMAVVSWGHFAASARARKQCRRNRSRRSKQDALDLLGRIVCAYVNEIAVGEVGADGSAVASASCRLIPAPVCCTAEYRGGVEAYLVAGARALTADGVMVLCGDARADDRVGVAAGFRKQFPEIATPPDPAAATLILIDGGLRRVVDPNDFELLALGQEAA